MKVDSTLREGDFVWYWGHTNSYEEGESIEQYEGNEVIAYGSLVKIVKMNGGRLDLRTTDGAIYVTSIPHKSVVPYASAHYYTLTSNWREVVT